MKPSYGLSYMGSKTLMCGDVPIVRRPKLVDLFGGGGSLAHYLATHGAGVVLYNDINPAIVAAFVAALTGRYRQSLPVPATKAERQAAAATDPVVAAICCFKPTWIEQGFAVEPNIFRKRTNRFHRLFAAGIADLVICTCADYQAFAQLRADPSVGWYVDPPYRDGGGYADECAFDWRWAADIAGPVVGFDSFVPDGFRMLWRREHTMLRNSAATTTFCFWKKASVNAEIDDFECATQCQLL